ERPAGGLLRGFPVRVEGRGIQRSLRERLVDDVPEVLVVVARDAALPRMGEQVLDREETAEVDWARFAVLRRSLGAPGRGFVEGHLDRFAAPANELHERQVVHPAAAADQGSGIREEANELLWRRRVEHEDPIERLIGDRREDPYRGKARGLEPTGASGPPLRIGLADHDMF